MNQEQSTPAADQRIDEQVLADAARIQALAADLITATGPVLDKHTPGMTLDMVLAAVAAAAAASVLASVCTSCGTDEPMGTPESSATTLEAMAAFCTHMADATQDMLQMPGNES
jgi:hypothetical protein